MPDDTVIRFTGAFEKSIPDFFEELWALVALPEYEVPNVYFEREYEERHQYYDQRGSTGIIAWSCRDTSPDVFERNLKIEYEDKDCNAYQMVLHHNTQDRKYKLAMPIAPTLEGPYDGITDDVDEVNGPFGE